MNGHLVRTAQHDDADAVARLLHDFNTEFGEPAPAPAVLAQRVARLLEEGDTVILLAGADPHGVAVLRFRLSIWTAGLECHLAELYVVPGMRRRGLGLALMHAAMREARERGADWMDISVDEPDTGARLLYERLGFTNRSGEGMMFYYEREL